MQSRRSFSNRIQLECINYASWSDSYLFLYQSTHLRIIQWFLYQHQNFFENLEWQRFKFAKWQIIILSDIVEKNSSLDLSECLRKLITDLDSVQREINLAYRDSIHLRENVIRTCKNHSILIHDLTNFSANTSTFISMLHTNIVNYEIVVKWFINQQQYVQDQNEENEYLFVNRRFRQDVSSFNRRDNNKNFRENLNFNNNFSSYGSRIQLDSKKCFLCEKFDCWFTNYSIFERDQFKKRFSNRVSQFKTRLEFDRRLKQYIVDYEDIKDENNYINQYYEKLSIDVFFEEISISSTFIIEFNEHFQTFNESKTKCFLISHELLNNSKTITNVLVNKTFRHRLISSDIIILAFAISILYTFNVSIESRYDDREFKNLLIDHDVAIRSSKNIE
jgi:hypothetical protein